MDEVTARGAGKRANPHLAVGKKRLQPKPLSPPAGPCSSVREKQSATALADVVLPTSFHLPLHSDDILPDGNTYPSWGGPTRWSSSTALEPPLCWNHNELATMTSIGFATNDTAQNRESNIISPPHRELGFPATDGNLTTINDTGSCNMGGTDGSLSYKPFERWHVPDHSTAPFLTASFANLVHYPSLPYTDAHAYTHTRPHAAESIGLFDPGSNIAELQHGFTGAGDTSPSFRYPHVNFPAASAFPYEKPRNLGAALFDPENKFSVSRCHSGHVFNANRHLGPDGFHVPGNNGPWYEAETPTPSFDPIVTQPSPQGHSFLAGGPRWNGHYKRAITGLGRPMTNASKVAQGEEKTPRPRRPRGQLLPRDREETSNTRKRKACIRCRMQKIRCIPDPSKPETECCLCCRKVLLLETKKVIHRIPCLRWNLNEAVLFRVGGLEFTKRWTGMSVENIQPCDWADERVVTIHIGITTLLCDALPLKVRRFKPNSTDIQHRRWQPNEAEPPVWIHVPAYALADVDAASQDYRRFIALNAEEAIRRFTQDTTVDYYVRSTFAIALCHSAKVANKGFEKTKGDPAKLFRSYFRLWLASRFTIGTAYMTNGDEALERSTYPPAFEGGRQFVSRMITAQFDSIGYKHVLAKLKREVLEELWLLMQKRTETTFFTVYLVVFMMLHEISVACQDRRRRAKEQGLNTYYDLEDVAAKIQHGADIILGHWHYYKGDLDPLAVINGANAARVFGNEYPQEVELLRMTCEKFADMKNKRCHGTGWEQDPLHLVSLMFEPNWQPFQSIWP
ncbi:hypothetical protein F5Y08DRAFT_326160 [Xylaria arbuscula]|nr:hypothetical protein F5Y08DRAFT_326160 [Xylaria arbuscula]